MFGIYRADSRSRSLGRSRRINGCRGESRDESISFFFTFGSIGKKAHYVLQPFWLLRESFEPLLLLVRVLFPVMLLALSVAASTTSSFTALFTEASRLS